MGWGGPGYQAPPPRPLGITLAAVYLLVMGLFTAGILGGCGLIIGSAFLVGASQEGETGAGAVGLAVGILPLIIGILSIAAGIGTFARGGWARWVGIVASVLALLYFGVIGLLFFAVKDLSGQSPLSGVGIVLASIAVLYVLCAIAYFMSGSYFSNRR
jgi:hypothetical protein